MKRRGIILIAFLALLTACASDGVVGLVAKSDDESAHTPSITWIDDDGVKLSFDRLAPIAREHEIPMTFAVITSRFEDTTGRFMTREEVMDAYNEGFDIVDHSYAHDKENRPTDMTSDELREDLKLSKSIWEEMGIPHNIHVIPFGANPPASQRIYEELFDGAIMTTRSESDEGYGIPNYFPLENHKIGRISYNYSSLNYIQAQIDDAAANNGWAIIMSHMAVDDFDETKINSIVNYAKSNGLEFITVEEGLNRFSK